MMVQIGNVPEINNVKNALNEMMERKWITEWELPYENLLTRLTAAIFFVSIEENVDPNLVWNELIKYGEFTYGLNEDESLSSLIYQVDFTNNNRE